MMRNKKLYLALLLIPLLVAPALQAEERSHSPEQMEALAKGGDLQADLPKKLRNLPDLTKGDPPPQTKDKPEVWTFGPTGVVGTIIGGFGGYQILVKGVLKGSPAEGNVLPGDVITGINDQAFKLGGHIGIEIGNAIINAEEEAKAGQLKLNIWRDLNYVERNKSKDLASVDIDDLFEQARDDSSLYDWKPEEARAQEVRQMGFDEFPLKPSTLDVDLKLRTFPSYSETAPYDCPKTIAILEDAWKVLEKKFVADPNNPRSGRGGIIEAIALLASGKPEHRKIVHEWVRGPHSPWRAPTVPPGTMFEPRYKGYKGYQSWHHGYKGLYCAIYYDVTGDEFVLPALRKYAIDTALGQSAHGSWGHTFAYPSFNGGEFNRMNPGYGALNAAGNRCFFLIALAKKLGIEHPEIDKAIERAQGFFSSYIDQGCIPYGDHGAYGSDDSNGKNAGVAYALKLLGDDYGSRYFAMMSSHCAFTRRGGHGHDYHGNWSSWAANLLGPEIRAYNERNLRWRRTLCRMYDGSFVYHSPTGGKYGALRDPTATEVLHQSSIFKQTLITGKDVDEADYINEREMQQMLTSAAGQLNDPKLKELAGTPWKERPTEEVLDLLDIFYPKARGGFAKELATRYQAGETEILPRLLELLKNDNPRYRDGALRAITVCGNDAILSNLSQIIPLLEDSEDFVRVSAVRLINNMDGGNEEAQLATLQAVIDNPKAIAPNSVRNTAQNLFTKDIPLANQPFEAGFDKNKVYEALEKLILIDPAGKSFLKTRADTWSKDTVVRLAGPLTYAAEEEQIADQMFANRSEPAQAVLGRYGYREATHATAHRLVKQAAIPRHLRPYVGFKRAMMHAKTVKANPGAFVKFLPDMETVLTDNPNATVTNPEGKDKIITPINELYLLVKENKNKAVALPSIAADVSRVFNQELEATGSTGAKIKLCQQELRRVERMSTFRKLAAMDYLADILGPDAIEELVPYLDHHEPRLRHHSRQLTANLIRSGGAPMLEMAMSDTNMVGALHAFGLSGDASGTPICTKALKHEDPQVRQAAIEALAQLEGSKAMSGIIEHLAQAKADEDRTGCENALLALAAEPAFAANIRDSVAPLCKSELPDVRSSAYYILARLGDDGSINLLRKSGETDSLSELARLAEALSYSTSRKADQLMLDLARTDTESARAVGPHSVRRLVLGPKGFGDLTDAERMSFAEPMLQLNMDRKLIQFLGQVYHARALRALMDCLERGYSGAADSLISNAEAAPGYSPTDAKIAAKALEDVIEYIEITQLRGGAKGKDFREYPKWKALQARAGKALLKVHQPETEAIPTFDLLDFE